MKNRVLAFLLALSFLLMSLPMTVMAEGETDTEEPAVTPAADTILFSNASNNTSPSSSTSTNRWNKLQPSKGNTYMQVVADPEDEDVQVTAVVGKTTGCTLQRTYIPKDAESVFEASLYIAPPISGSRVQTMTLKLGGNTLLALSHNTDTDRYTFTCGTQTGSISPESWYRTSVCITPTDEAGKADFAFFLYGDILLSDGSTVTAISAVFEGKAFTNNTWQIDFGVPADSEAGFYIRDAINYLPGDFVADEPILPLDSEGTAITYGQIVLPLSHTPDMSTLTPANIQLTTLAGDAAVISAIGWRERDNALVLDFIRNPLLENIDYLLSLDGVKDVAGRSPFTSDFVFRLLSQTGGEGEETPAPTIPPYETPLALPEYGYIMPDRYNTGYRCAEEDLVPAHEKYPACFGTGNTSSMTITDTTAALYNYDFSGFSLTGGITIKATSPVSIHDFYLYATSYYGIQNTGGAMATISWMEGEHSLAAFFNASNITLRHCYVHDVCADHMKGASNQLVESCYFRDGGTRTPGAHADVIQYSGSSDNMPNNSRVMGNRFDIPFLHYDHVANCCFFFKPESNVMGFANIQASGNWFNGGGYTTYLTPACSLDNIHYITYTNNKIGYGHHFGPLTWGAYETVSNFLTYEGNAFVDNGYVTTLEAGSIVFYAVNGEQKTRVYSVADLTTTELEVLVNFANYMTVARSYRIEVKVRNAQGEIVSSANGSDSIIRYTPVKGTDGYLHNNTQQITITNSDGTTSTVTALINMPNLPSDVEATVRLTGLPANMSDYTVSVEIFDTTSDLAANTMIRSSVLGDSVVENEAVYAVTPSHTVTFTGLNGRILGTATVKHGRAVTLPTPPQEDGYVFLGWSDNGVTINADTTIAANYTAGHIVTFYGFDNVVLSTQDIIYGQSATAPVAPYVYGYVFSDWDIAFDNVTRNLDVHAIYLPVLSVIFRAADGTVLKVEHVNQGGSATPPDAPALDGHTFSGWVGNYTNITENSIVTASYTGIFTVTFLGYRDAILSTQVLTAGQAAVPPTLQNTAYRLFDGWSTDAYLNVQQNLTVRALFTQLYDVTFLDRDGNILSTQRVVHGRAATPPTPPAVTGYDFVGWSADTTSVTSTMTVQAVYAQLFTVTFRYDDGTVINTQTVRCGEAATAPTPAAERGGAAFACWDTDFSQVTEDLTVTALYGDWYTVVFRGDNGTVLKTQAVASGTAATAPTAPEKENHRFAGWDKAFDNVTENLQVNAVYVRVYTVLFVDADGTLLKTAVTDTGTAAVPPSVTPAAGYVFAGWDKAFDNVTQDMTVTAQYTETQGIIALRAALAQAETQANASLTQCYQTLSAAITAWQNLSAAEKAARPELLSALQDMLDDYNAMVQALNRQMANAEAASVQN